MNFSSEVMKLALFHVLKIKITSLWIVLCHAFGFCKVLKSVVYLETAYDVVFGQPFMKMNDPNMLLPHVNLASHLGCVLPSTVVVTVIMYDVSCPSSN